MKGVLDYAVNSMVISWMFGSMINDFEFKKIKSFIKIWIKWKALSMMDKVALVKSMLFTLLIYSVLLKLKIIIKNFL